MRLSCTLTLVALAFTPFAASADLLYANAGGVNGEPLLIPSQNADSFNHPKQADNFMIADDSSIEHVRFWGVAATGNLALITGFHVRVYEDNAGAPGTLVSTELVLSDSVSTAIVTGAPVFALTVYEAPLTTPVTVSGGQPYWIAIVAQYAFDAQGLFWDWQTSPDTDGTNVHTQQNFTDTWSPSGFPDEIAMAFALVGSPAAACPADIDNDGDTDPDDITAFVSAFTDAIPNNADVDGDGDEDPDDISAFVNAFIAGC